ncbi:MAG: hypothetical protein H6706_15770 [Myxococcales bacterium]|nr:hypothetical protein [Myxococcales bacterium]
MECPHCQGYAEVDLDHQGPVQCPDCHRTFAVGHDPLLGGGALFDGADPKAERSLLEPATTDQFGLTTPPVGFDFSRLTGENMALPGGDVNIELSDLGAPVDLSVLMDQAPRRGGEGGGVSLGDLGGVGGLEGPGRLRDDEDATRVLDVAPSASVWRARTGRGLVYELMSVDAVVAWLQGREDLTAIRIARGTGDFATVDAFPELASRVGKRADAPSGARVSSFDDDAPILLDERDDRGPSPAASGEREVSPLRGESEEAAAQRARRAAAPVPARTVGFGLVLGVALAAGLLLVGGVIVGQRTGILPAADRVVSVDAPGPPAPALAAAIAALDAGQHAAAVEALRKLEGPDADPRVYRYLALALARGRQTQEADEALARYRRAMLRLSGEHGRQVRELRD